MCSQSVFRPFPLQATMNVSGMMNSLPDEAVQAKHNAATEENIERRRPSMEKEDSLRLVDFTHVNTPSSDGASCQAQDQRSSESSTSALTSGDQVEELPLSNLRPQALGDNTLHNSSRIFGKDLLDAIQKDAKQGTNSISNFDASTSAADGLFQAKNLFFATDQVARAAAKPKGPHHSPMKMRSSSDSASSTSSLSSSKSKKRSVSFHGSTRCRPHITINQFTPDEFYATWRNESDKSDAQKETLTTARKMKKLYAEWFASDNNAGNLAEYLPVEEQPWYVDTETETSRGIEHMRSKPHTQARREQKRYIVDAVLYEQFAQRQSGMNDSGGLAMTSYGISENCREWAGQKALGDAIHGEKRRESLLAKYTPAARRMSRLDAQLLAGLEKLAEEDEDEEEEGRGSQRKLRDNEQPERRRSSAISFEKHDSVIAEELNALVDDEDEDEDDEDGDNSADNTSNQTSKEQEASVISKFEMCTLDEQVASGRLQMHQNTGGNAFIEQLNNGTECTSAASSSSSDHDDIANLASRRRRTSFQFLTSSGTSAAAAQAAALAAACLEDYEND